MGDKASTRSGAGVGIDAWENFHPHAGMHGAWVNTVDADVGVVFGFIGQDLHQVFDGGIGDTVGAPVCFAVAGDFGGGEDDGGVCGCF